MAATIQESCAKIMKTIICSSLNFTCQETPYSIYVTIRKSWSKVEQDPGHIHNSTESTQQMHVDSDRACREATTKIKHASTELCNYVSMQVHKYAS